MSSSETPEYKALRRKWYAKLKKSGFQDIERADGTLTLWASHFFKVRYNAEKFAAKEAYYRYAGHFLNEHDFDSKLEKLIWQLHSEGLGCKDILAKIPKRGIRLSFYRVSKVVKTLSKQMMKRYITSGP